MRTKVVLALTLFVLLTTGKTPGFRELRNPDAEHHGGRAAVAGTYADRTLRETRARRVPTL